MRTHIAVENEIVVPEIADYEVRRELLRINATKGLLKLDSLVTLRRVRFLPIDSNAMRLAAQYWAEARRSGRPTAHPAALDGDVIIAAQAVSAAQFGDRLVVATNNAAHISRFVAAADWQEIVV